MVTTLKKNPKQTNKKRHAIHLLSKAPKTKVRLHVTKTVAVIYTVAVI